MASSGNSNCPASADLVATSLAKEFSFLWSSEVDCERAIKKVSTLLEEGRESRQTIWLEREQVYDNLLRCIEARVPCSRRDDNDAVRSTCANRRYGVLHSAVRAILKLEQHLFSEWKAERRMWNTDGVRRIVNALQDVVKDQDCPSDIVFLAGTAFSFHLHSLEVNAAEAARLFIVTLFGDKGLEDAIVALDTDVARKPPPLHALPLMYGLFVCGKSDILMSECGASNSGPIVLQLFQWIAKFCETCNAAREFQAFQTLVAWLRCIERNVTVLAVHFDASSPLLDVIMRLLDLGWCSPVPGVADLSWDAFRILLQVHRNEKLVADLLSATLDMSWAAKGKYPRLAAIVKYVGASKLLIQRPNFLEELSESLASSRLSSASRVVYRAFSMQFRSELGDLSDEELSFRCDHVFHPSLIGALHSSITVHNAIRYWLPVMLQVFPCALAILMCRLKDIHRRKHSAESMLLVLSTLRLARSHGIIDNSSWTLQMPDFEVALRHFDDDIRAEAFAAVCSSKKKSECVSGAEMEFIRKFLPNNLNVDNASFRRKVLCNFKYLLVRLRSHCIRLLSKAEKNISQVDSVSLSETTDFLHWLIEVSQGGLLPGGCYQRRTTCLGLYKCVLDVFVSTPSGNCRKGIVPDRCENLLDYFRLSGKCSVLDSANERRIVFCLFDPMDDVQSTSAGLLARHFPGLPATFLGFAGADVDDRNNSIVMWALRLCANPKTMHTHSGSQLLSLVCRRAETPELKVRVVGLILSKLLDQLAVARISLQQAASSAPMHGLLLALRFVLHLNHDNRRHAIEDNIEEILDITEQIVQYVLGVLSSRSSQETVVPSFGEMGVAIEDVVVTDASSPITTSSEYQLVLSCCWLSLKESCLLIGNVVHLYLLDPKDDKNGLVLSLGQVRRAARILLSVLTKCRHRGVIESCDDGFELLCRTLLDGGQPSLISIVFDMLNEALVELEDGSNVLSTSVTRRSAGLALLIATIIRCDHRPTTPLLTETVRRLLAVAEKPLLELPITDDGLVDVPQAHAFHVFKALVHDAALSKDILRDVAPITMVCLRGFYSSSWAVRNAALQLFGAVVPTIVGQKKSSENDENVEDDAASPNDGNQTTTTFSEFFARWPQLGDAIEEQMSLTSDLSGLRPTVVPILSLLCSLAPDDCQRVEALCARVQPMLASNVWHVRYLAAQFIAGTCRTQSRRKLFEDVCDRLCMCTEITSNERHGRLVLLKYLVVTISPSETPLDDQLTGRLLNTVVYMSLFNWSFCPVLGATALEIIDMAPKWMLTSTGWWSRAYKEDTLFARSVRKLGFHSGKPGFSSVLKRTHLGKLQACRSIKDLFRQMPAETAAVEELEAFSAALHQLALSSKSIDDDDRDMSDQWCENGRHLSAFLRICSDRRVLVNEILQTVMTAYTRMAIKMISLSESLSFVEKPVGHQFCFTSAIALAVSSTTIDADLQQYYKMYPKPSVIEVNIKCFFKHLRRFCEPRMSVHFRLWAARSLTNCAARLLSMFERSDHGNNFTAETRLEYIICEIFHCCVTLLQDEQPDVRKEAMRSVISLQPYHIHHDQLPAQLVTRPVPVHSNVAIQMLSDHFVSRFAWNQELRQYLWRKVGGSIDQQTYAFRLSTVADCSTHSRLFEQDEVNVYAEKCFMSRFFGHIIERLVLKSSCSAEWSWLPINQVETRARLLIEVLASSGEVNVELHCRPDVARLVANTLVQLDVVLLLQHHFSSDGGVGLSAPVVVEIRDDLRRQIGLPVNVSNLPRQQC